MKIGKFTALLAGLSLAVAAATASFAAEITLLNASYDPTRELYVDFNNAFAQQWQKKPATRSPSGSPTGSGKQARAVIDGLEADVVTRPGVRYRRHCRKGFDQAGLAKENPHNSSPTPPPSSSWYAKAIRRISRTGVTR
jgi:sulfate transport system substrate-binding protein